MPKITTELSLLGRHLQEALNNRAELNVCNDPIAGDNPGELVFWVQYPFKPSGLKKDLGKQYRITLREDDL